MGKINASDKIMQKKAKLWK